MSDHANAPPESDGSDPFDGLDELHILDVFETKIILEGYPPGLAMWRELPLANKLKVIAAYRAMVRSEK